MLSFESQVVLAKCVKVYDGDTIHVVFRLHGELIRFKCRMTGYDSPELNSKDADTKAAAFFARDRLAERILDKNIECHFGKFEKYGRLLVTVYYKGENINNWMLDHGYGVVYPPC